MARKRRREREGFVTPGMESPSMLPLATDSPAPFLSGCGLRLTDRDPTRRLFLLFGGGLDGVRQMWAAGKHKRRINCGAWSDEDQLAYGSDDKQISVTSPTGQIHDQASTSLVSNRQTRGFVAGCSALRG